MDIDSGNPFSLFDPSLLNPFSWEGDPLNPLSSPNSPQLPSFEISIPDINSGETSLKEDTQTDFLTGLSDFNDLIAQENLPSSSLITHSQQLGEVFVVPGENQETVDLLFQWTYREGYCQLNGEVVEVR